MTKTGVAGTNEGDRESEANPGLIGVDGEFAIAKKIEFHLVLPS